MGDDLIGAVLGDYEVEQHIARGGMGEVYRGRQVSLDRSVAIKVLPLELCADHDYIDRFLREARAAAHLNHPNIIQIFDAGVSDNIYFFVMELVEGKNLGQILREQGRIKEHEALYMIQQVAEGLAFAHKMGVIHRDVKPENIMVTNHGAVKIGDLGLARWKPNEFEVNMSSSGITMGTPNYISPEQIYGLKDIDARADVYSLGMTLYHLLAGRPAFAGATPSKIMAQHLSDPIPPLKNSLSDVSQDTTDLVDAMTAKERGDRIQDMAEVAEIIAQMLGYERTVTPRRGLPGTAQAESGKKSRNSRRNIWLTGANSVVVIILVGLFLALVGIEYWKTHRNSSDARMLEHQQPQETEEMLHEDEADQTIPTSLPVTVSSHELQSDDLKSVVKETNVHPGESSALKKIPASSKPDDPRKVFPQPSQVGSLPERKSVPPEGIPATAEKAPPAELRILGPKFLRGLTISSRPSGQKPSKSRNEPPVGTASPSDFLVGASSTHGDSKTLLRVEHPDFPQRILKCSSATLELTLTSCSKDVRDLEIEVCELLQPWGVSSLDGETNWEWASLSRRIRWWKPGASSNISDYIPKAFPNADAPGQNRFKITPEALNHPLRFNILTGSQQQNSDVNMKEKFGWIIQAVRGAGEVCLAPVDDSSGPCVVILNPPSVDSLQTVDGFVR